MIGIPTAAFLRVPHRTCLLSLLLSSIPPITALRRPSEQQVQEVPITVQRISRRVVNFRVGDHPLFGDLVVNNVVAVSSEDGIVVVDTGYFPSSANELRKLITEVFGRDDFAYVINTHSHWDHVSGNQAFSDIPIIGHANLPGPLARFEEGLTAFFDSREARMEYWRDRLSQLEPGTPEALEAAGWAWAHGCFLEEAKMRYEVIPPRLTFREQLTLHLGDLTLELVHVPGLHTEEDLVVYIPEEGVLITGDLFSPGQGIQIPDSAFSTVPMALEMLSRFLESDPPPKMVIPGHCCLQDAAWLEEMCRCLRDSHLLRLQRLRRKESGGFSGWEIPCQGVVAWPGGEGESPLPPAGFIPL